MFRFLNLPISSSSFVVSCSLPAMFAPQRLVCRPNLHHDCPRRHPPVSRQLPTPEHIMAEEAGLSPPSSARVGPWTPTARRGRHKLSLPAPRNNRGGPIQELSADWKTKGTPTRGAPTWQRTQGRFLCRVERRRQSEAEVSI